MSHLKDALIKHATGRFGDGQYDHATIEMVAEMIDQAVMEIEIEIEAQFEKLAINAVRKALEGKT